MKKDYDIELDFIIDELVIAYENYFKQFIDHLAPSHETTKGVITQKLKDKFDLKDWEIQLLFENLLSNGHISGIDPLIISYQGLILINNGGYIQQKKDKLSEKRRIIRNDRLLANGTVVLAIGTIGLLIWEILIHWNEFINLFCDC